MPTSTEIIRKAVELADGWEMHHDNEGFVRYFDNDEHNFMSFYLHDDYRDERYFGLDALAAQLVRQVDELDTKYILMDGFGKAIIQDTTTITNAVLRIEGPDRTMNTIKAIVESGVLDE